MKLSIAAFAVAMFAEAALAANCKGGLEYCGRTLLKIGMVLPSVFHRKHQLTLSRRLP
jgi:hypothetical protein